MKKQTQKQHEETKPYAALLRKMGPLLSAKEVERLVLMALASGPKSEAKLKRLVEWAEDCRINSGLLGNVLEGSMAVQISDEGDLQFSLTGAGSARVESMLAAAKR